MRDVRRFVSAWRGHPVELRDLLGIVGETLVIRMSWPRSPTVGAAPGKQPALKTEASKLQHVPHRRRRK